MRLEDYPPGVQCLLKDARWHLEQLGLLERDFRAWQAAQGESVQAATLAEVAQQRWETVMTTTNVQVTRVVD